MLVLKLKYLLRFKMFLQGPDGWDGWMLDDDNIVRSTVNWSVNVSSVGLERKLYF